MTYNVFGGTLNLVQSICSQIRSQLVGLDPAAASWHAFHSSYEPGAFLQ